MAFEIKYTSKAKSDIFKAIEYYEEVGLKKISTLFYESILQAEETLISINHFEQIYKDFHRLPLFKFPYILIYKINIRTKVIEIYRVFNNSQDPINYPKN